MIALLLALLSMQAFPTVPPIDLVGPSASSGDCQAVMVDGYSAFVRNNIARSFKSLTAPCRGQHINRPIGNRPNPLSTRAYLVVWVVDPTVDVGGTYPGVGLVATIRVNNTVDGADGTGVNAMTDGGGLHTRQVTKNAPYTVQLVSLPSGYVIPERFKTPMAVPVTDKDVLVVIEAIKPR